MSGCAMTSLTPLGEAAKNNNTQAVKSILEKGFNPCQKNQSGLNSYMWSFDHDEVSYNYQRTCNKNEAYSLVIEKAFELMNTGMDCPALLNFAAASGCDEIVTKLLDKSFDIESIEQGFTPLGWAALYKQENIAKLLVKRGADLEAATVALKKYEENSIKNNMPSVNAYIRAGSSVILMRHSVEAARFKKNKKFEAEEKINEDLFQKAIQAHQIKPELTEDVRKFKIQAEGAVKDKDFVDAAKKYEQALRLAPGWPEGHFNRALVLGETYEFAIAITEMKRYLTLVPTAGNARAAQDKIYEWERKVDK